MLIVGMRGMSEAQSRSMFSLWCVMAAPLIAGNDLRKMSESTVEILTNLEAIAVDQDPLGRQGHVVCEDKVLSVRQTRLPKQRSPHSQSKGLARAAWHNSDQRTS